MIFKWCIIRHAHDYGVSSVLKQRNMYFEDFLRVSSDRVYSCVADGYGNRASGRKRRGEFILELHAAEQIADHVGELAAFVEARRVGWVHEPRQLVHRCVTHFMTLIMRTVERNTNRCVHGKANMLINNAEATEFQALRKKGAQLNRVTGRAGLLDGIRAAASIVRRQLLQALRHVDIFERLDDGQLGILADAMADAPFEQDEWVFEQGDEGNTFFVIIEGKATEVHYEMSDDGHEVEHELAVLTDGMFFGERSLIKNQTRYAGVHVDSVRLHCVYITREDFEHALGCPMEDLLPDAYKIDHTELMRALHEVPLLASLSMKQLRLMVDGMSEVHLPKGEFVFHEGEEGDAFYIVERGTAVMRKRTLEEDEGLPGGAVYSKDEVLNELNQWDCFGERALLRDQVRYASVEATSHTLSLLMISREGFEQALGVPPRELLKEITMQDERGASPGLSRRDGPRDGRRQSDRFQPYLPNLLSNQSAPSAARPGTGSTSKGSRSPSPTRSATDKPRPVRGRTPSPAGVVSSAQL